MRGEDIICFAKDWTEVPTSNNHVMWELARENRVLWLNSVATRTPDLRSGRDVGKILRKLAGFLRGPVRVGPRMWVYTPIVLPFPHSPLARAVNRLILQTSIGQLRRRLGFGQFQLWTFLPNVADYLRGLPGSILVYYCVDEWSKFSCLDGEQTAAAERRLCREADVVFATASSLVARRRHLNPETHLATHGVDHRLFSRALDDNTAVPEELRAVPRPVLGFFGTIREWVDLDLLSHLAGRHPEWSIVLIGDVSVDVSALRRHRNVHFLGRKPHAALPAYCKGFSVGLIPQKVNELTRHMNPIKLREYLSAGLPVCATALPEAAAYEGDCRVAESYAAFEAAVAEAIRTDSPEQRRRRSEAMREETWESKVGQVSARVMSVKAKRCGEKAK